jgi:hypothetical protein
MSMLGRVTAVAVILSATAACGGGSDQDEVAACVQRGIDYFKSIESYPTLKSPPNQGRSAEEVARERCNRTTTAF